MELTDQQAGRTLGRMETWRGVAEFPRYEVSDLGNVRYNHAGNVRPLRLTACPKGYVQVGFRPEKRRRVTKRVHLLVAAAFLGPRPLGMEVNHKNGIKTDASAGNLEYVTSSYNKKHAWVTGLRKPPKPGGFHCGENHHSAKLTEDDVTEIRRRRASGELPGKLAAEFGVSYQLVWAVVTRRAWIHVP